MWRAIFVSQPRCLPLFSPRPRIGTETKSQNAVSTGVHAVDYGVSGGGGFVRDLVKKRGSEGRASTDDTGSTTVTRRDVMKGLAMAAVVGGLGRGAAGEGSTSPVHEEGLPEGN
jgi:hypothetical protein